MVQPDRPQMTIQDIHKRMVQFTMYLVWKPHHYFVYILYNTVHALCMLDN
jgi:hypothetical protein